jgi:hypothetical protein
MDDGVRERHGVTSSIGGWVNVREENSPHITVHSSDGVGGRECVFTPAEARRFADQLRWLADRIDERDRPGEVVVMGLAAPLGAAGGRARARNLSPERRSEIARAAAKKRWSK